MKFINLQAISNKKRWLIIILAFFALAATYTSAISLAKDPEVGVIVPANDYEPAWYINPGTKEKLFLVQPVDAFRVMKKFGVGIKHAKLQEYLKKGFPKSLAGKILLDVGSRGQAYYVSTLDLKGYFLGNPNFALLVLRENGFKLNKAKSDIELGNPLAEERRRTTPLETPVTEQATTEVVKPDLNKTLIVETQPISETSGFSKIVAVRASVINETDLTITERGVVWGLSANPSIDNNIGVTKCKAGEEFLVNIDGLLSEKTYYIKAYAIADGKIFYGNEQIFTTPRVASGSGGGSGPAPSNPPTVSTNSLTIVGISGLSAVGQITNDGGGSITAKGVCWSTSTNPTLGVNCTDDGAGKDEFTGNITGLDPETIYYVRAYATNSAGTSYGNELVTCGGTTVNDSEGNPYNVVKIGSQCWLKENLHLGTMIGAALADNVTVQGQSNDSIIEKYCYGYVQQGNAAQIVTGTANCATDGGLYQWPEALGLPYDCKNAASVDNGNGTYTLSCPISGSKTITAKQRGICPSGWHIPTVGDYQTLSQRADPGCNLAGSSCSTAGGKLKATALHSPVAWDGTDIYNFSVMPTGYLYYLTFSHHRDHAPFWVSLPDLSDPINSWGFGIAGVDPVAYASSGNNRADGFSVRCVRD